MISRRCGSIRTTTPDRSARCFFLSGVPISKASSKSVFGATFVRICDRCAAGARWVPSPVPSENQTCCWPLTTDSYQHTSTLLIYPSFSKVLSPVVMSSCSASNFTTPHLSHDFNQQLHSQCTASTRSCENLNDCQYRVWSESRYCMHYSLLITAPREVCYSQPYILWPSVYQRQAHWRVYKYAVSVKFSWMDICCFTSPTAHCCKDSQRSD